jgi:hypothetical protein
VELRSLIQIRSNSITDGRNEHTVNLVSDVTRPYYEPMSSALARFHLRLNNIFRPGGKVFYAGGLSPLALACSGWLP